MDVIYPDVYRVFPSKVTPSKYVSFFVKRKDGNVLFPCFGGHSSIDAHFDELESMGGVSVQLLGDMHFAAKYNDDVFDRFGAALHCSDVEAPDVTRKVNHVETFAFERHEVLKGVEAIPTPGHRPGAVSYLLTIAGKRMLFAGDTIYHDGDRWRCFTSKKNSKTMQSTLDALKEIPFDVLLANTSVENPICHVDLDEQQRIQLLDDVKASI